MPRRNRRAPSEPARHIRSLSAAQRASLCAFAHEHLAEHTAALDRAAADELPVTGSEHPSTGVRFLSVGLRPDPRAIRLATSDAPGRVAG